MGRPTKQRVRSLAALLAAGVAVLAANPPSAAEVPAEHGPLPAIEADPVKAKLGKRLFFDRRLSGDAAIACATCHKPENGFGHPDALSPGYPGNKHFRNAPTLINTAHKKAWLHDGRIGTNLDDVGREMLTEDYSMNMDMRIMQERLKQDPVYLDMFTKAGLGEPSHGGTRKAIVEYLKTLTSHGAPFDSGKLSASARRGFDLFKGKANCITCHSGPTFSDGKAHNTGVPENFDVFLDPMRHQAFISYAMFHGIENYMSLKRDPGRHVYTHNADGSDLGTFMTPTLRELEHTAPYMHNGMLTTLQEVVAFYNHGGGVDRNKSTLLKPLNLSWQEQTDLVEFLKALSGEPLTGEEYVWTQDYPQGYEAIADWRDVKN